MVHYALGQLLQRRERHSEAEAVYTGITISVNPQSAQAYWALGKVRAEGYDEWESDPDDVDDPSHCYAQAAALQPTEFQLDGTRIRRIEPMTPEREEEQNRRAIERRQRILQELKDGTRSLDYGRGNPDGAPER
jgi:hypothetical protein